MERALPSAAAVRAARHGLYESGVAPNEEGEQIPLVPHGMPLSDTDGLVELATAEGVTRTLEIGIGIGLSALALCESLLSVDAAAPAGSHTVIDPFAFGGDVGVRTVRDAGVEELVHRVRGPSQVVLPRMTEGDQRFDLALVDGGHRFHEVFLDLVYCDRLVKPGAPVVIDDLWMPAIRAATSYMERNLDYVLDSDALPGGFRKRRSVLARRRSKGRVAVLRKPLVERERAFDYYQGFDK